jgi:4-oxalomesaconate tautomerase
MACASAWQLPAFAGRIEVGGIPAMWMRGGTSKGVLFLGADLPADPATRAALLLQIMGSPDRRQIDGLGGGDPLTSKVAIVSPAATPGADIDYLFLQVWVEAARISDTQVCGNMLAAVGPFAIERGLVRARSGETPVTVRQVNDGSLATVVVQTPDGAPRYAGDTAIDGVPGTAAPVLLGFGRAVRLPAGTSTTPILGTMASLMDAGMPIVVLAAADLGLTGHESPAALEADTALVARVEAIRRAAGVMMGLGDVSAATVPKVALVAPPSGDGTIASRMFIPHKVHSAVGVLAAVSLAAACLLEDGPARQAARPGSGTRRRIGIEHPTGRLDCDVVLSAGGGIEQVWVVRTARKLMDGLVFARG